MAIQEEDDLYRQPGRDPLAKEFLALLAALPWLLRQCFTDAVKLLETEARLAFRSLLMVVGLTFCLATLIAGGWMTIVALGVYWAVTAGVALWLIILSVLALHLLIVIGLARQIVSLARFLCFPNSRRALNGLLSRPPTL